ncbi:MAG: alpha/beta hydrolase [Alphaproteobacteria bacterium]|nr:alpha/beta hydrolase [Alphaproteobacteria bacterium]
MAARQTRFYVTVGGVRLHYLEFAGDGPPLVLIPGITSPAAAWAFVGARLSQTNHVYILDNRGRGLSDQRPGLRYRLEDYALDIAGFIETLGLGKPIVLGHSMGGRICVKLAADHPDRVGSIVVVDPPVSGPGRRPYPTPLQPYLDAMRAASAGEPLPATPNWTPDQSLTRAEWLPSCSLEAVVQSHKGFHEEDFHADMPKVRCPTLLVYAELGGVVTEADAEEILGLIKGAKKVRVERAAHMIPWDNMDGFLAAVTPFITAR